MPNFTKKLNLEKPLRGEFYSIEKHNENSDKIDLEIEKITVPTIAHLKNMIELQVGDIVDIQGYYEAGDGAHHKRKIEVADDGSGVLLANDLWANIVHDGEVNASWFGAKGDGITDDTVSLKKFFGFNKINEGMIFRLNKGRFICNETIKIDWYCSNFWIYNSNIGCYEITGAGSMNTIIVFPEEAKDGIILNNDARIAVYKIKGIGLVRNGFSETDYQKINNPYIWLDEQPGIGLKYVHSGYQGVISDVFIDGFYIGLATRKCYGGPAISSVFVKKSIVGFSSYQDTTFTVKDCNFKGYQTGYHQYGGYSSLDNVVCEGNLHDFNVSSFLRENFKGDSFQIIEGQSNMTACYTEKVFGNSRFFVNARIHEEDALWYNSIKSETDTYPNVWKWYVDNNKIPYSVFIHMNNVSRHAHVYIKPAYSASTNIDVGVFCSTDYLEAMGVGYHNKIKKKYLPSVIIDRIAPHAGEEATLERCYSGGNALPVVNFYNGKNTTTPVFIKENLVPFIVNEQINATWASGKSLTLKRVAQNLFSDNSSKVVELSIGSNLDGNFDVKKDKIDISGVTTSTETVFTIANRIQTKGIVFTRGYDNQIPAEPVQQDCFFNLSTKKMMIYDGNAWKTYQFESVATQLDTPYYTAKMQQDGVYGDFITYMDEQHAYEQMQREVESQRQEAYQLALEDNAVLTYEDWLSSQPQLMPVIEPQPSQALLDFKKKYLG